jgi:hypothetical protein
VAKQPSLKQYAHQYREHGFSIIPCDRRNKCPVGFLLPKNDKGEHSWEEYKHRIATSEEVEAWFSHKATSAIGVIVGSVSGGLEVIDHDAPELFAPWCRVVEDISPGLMNKLVVAQTQSGGCHVYYHCEEIEGNQKLASAWTGGLRPRLPYAGLLADQQESLGGTHSHRRGTRRVVGCGAFLQ